MTAKQHTEAGSLGGNSVSVETLESRMCLSAAGAGVGVAPLMQYAARAEMRELANHLEYHTEQVFAFHAASTEGFRGEYQNHDLRPDGGLEQHQSFPSVTEFISGFGNGLVRVVIIRMGDGQLPVAPPSSGQSGGPAGDTSGEPTFNPGYSANPVTEPVTEPVISPPPVAHPVIGKQIDVTPTQQQQDQTTSSPVQQQQQQRRHATPSVELRETAGTATNATTIQTPLALDSRSLKSSIPVASASRLASAVLNGEEQAADGMFTAPLASALKSWTPAGTANFADLVVARLAGGAQGGLAHSIGAIPAQAAARVEGALVDAVAGTNVSRPRFFEFTHLGSPFALLSDSVANFVEDSASLPMAVVKGQKTGPWMLTAGVAIADVVLLTYMYRRSQKNRQRYQLARAYAYSPFAS